MEEHTGGRGKPIWGTSHTTQHTWADTGVPSATGMHHLLSEPRCGRKFPVPDHMATAWTSRLGTGECPDICCCKQSLHQTQAIPASMHLDPGTWTQLPGCLLHKGSPWSSQAEEVEGQRGTATTQGPSGQGAQTRQAAREAQRDPCHNPDTATTGTCSGGNPHRRGRSGQGPPPQSLRSSEGTRTFVHRVPAPEVETVLPKPPSHTLAPGILGRRLPGSPAASSAGRPGPVSILHPVSRQPPKPTSGLGERGLTLGRGPAREPAARLARDSIPEERGATRAAG